MGFLASSSLGLLDTFSNHRSVKETILMTDKPVLVFLQTDTARRLGKGKR
jgi:hypothetical protein